MLQDGLIASVAVLQKVGCLHGCFFVFRMFFGISTGCRIDFLQLTNGKGSFLRVLAGVALIEVNQLRFSLFQLHDDESHLQAPVAQMHVSDDLMAQETAHSLDALTDDG